MIHPRVSVIIPTHNRPELLLRALESVYAQTFTDIEVIVVDDGDAPRAEAVLGKYMERDNFRYIETKKHTGGSATRNFGIEHARGEFVAFLDDDDEWERTKLARLTDGFAGTDETVSLAFTGVRAVDAGGKELYTRLPQYEGVNNFHTRLLYKCFIWTSALMIRRTYTEKGYIFDEKLKKNQEWDLELRLAQVSSFVSVNEPLTIIHIGESEQLGSLSNIDNIIAGYEMFLKKHEAEYRENPHAHALRLFHVGHLYWQKGEQSQARTRWFRAWMLHRTNFVYSAHWLTSHWPWLYRQIRSPKV